MPLFHSHWYITLIRHIDLQAYCYIIRLSWSSKRILPKIRYKLIDAHLEIACMLSLSHFTPLPLCRRLLLLPLSHCHSIRIHFPLSFLFWISHVPNMDAKRKEFPIHFFFASTFCVCLMLLKIGWLLCVCSFTRIEWWQIKFNWLFSRGVDGLFIFDTFTEMVHLFPIIKSVGSFHFDALRFAEALFSCKICVCSGLAVWLLGEMRKHLIYFLGSSGMFFPPSCVGGERYLPNNQTQYLGGDSQMPRKSRVGVRPL